MTVGVLGLGLGLVLGFGLGWILHWARYGEP